MRIENHNPDVLTCLANLSSDEVFTPPQLANEMLDMLPPGLWQNPDATFLDPACKSGVFLREIAKRLDAGLAARIPDRQKRIDHICGRQLFGLAITELTGLLSRRSVYCSKTANGKYSVCTRFGDDQGNIRFRRIEHTWQDGRCVLCGADRENYERGEDLETYAYAFTHTENPEELFNVKFDVIVGNPPYQLSDGGFGRSASPIYHRFVGQAKKLQPRYLAMIIPSRWFGGGKGLDDFRREMLNDDRIRKIVDFEDSAQVFPGVSVAGGVCYFLWERERRGPCEVVNVRGAGSATSTRALNEFDVFIRQGEALPIVRKLMGRKERRMSEQVSSYKPFGLRTYVKPQESGDIKLYWQKGLGPYRRQDVTSGVDMIDKWKVVASRSGHEHAGNPGTDGSRRVLARTDVLPPGTVCTETYLVIGSYSTEREARNLLGYMKTKFFRFLMSLFMYSHGITKDTFAFIPVLDMSAKWSDQSLYERYSLTAAEIGFIESRIAPMEGSGE